MLAPHLAPIWSSCLHLSYHLPILSITDTTEFGFRTLAKVSVLVVCFVFWAVVVFCWCGERGGGWSLTRALQGWGARKVGARRVEGEKKTPFVSFSLRQLRSFFSPWGSFRGIVAAVQGHGPPKVHVWVSWGGVVQRRGGRKVVGRRESDGGGQSRHEHRRTP